MSFASKQYLVPERTNTAEVAETLAGDEALALEHGGTGVAATGADDAAKAVDVLKTWGVLDSGGKVPTAILPVDVADGIAPLDGSGDVPVANLPVMGAATESTAGTAGIVPAPEATDQFKPLCGDGDFRTAVNIQKIVDGVGTIAGLRVASLQDDAGTAVLDIAKVGTGENRLQVTATSSATKRARITCVNSGEAQIDLQLEPKGSVGRVSMGGDPLLCTYKRTKAIEAQYGAAAFSAIGLPAPTVATPGSAAASTVDANGYYVTVTYDGSGPTAASVSVPSCIQQRHEPDFHAAFRASFASGADRARLWVGMFSADPGGIDDLGAAGIRGAGIRLNANVDGSTIQFATSDGTTQTLTSTGKSIAANTLMYVRIRFLGASAGWECSFYNPSTFAFDSITVNTANLPGASQTLGLWASHSLAAGTANFALGLKFMGVHSL